ncbi:MAG: hypothetical protein ACU836_14615 [Gammaproteobacteria bacterium]
MTKGRIRPAFVLITENESATRRLYDSVGEEWDLLVSDPASMERILQLIDSVSANMAIVHVPSESPTNYLLLLEELHSAKPLMPVVVLADNSHPDMILAAMRSGASDLITLESPREEVHERLHLIMQKSARHTQMKEQADGKIFGIVSARPDSDSAILCLHLAIAMRKAVPNAKTLLLDLGVPEADSLSFLDLNVSYTFVDAVRSIRRFDETLIETAFAKHESGLALLAMSEDSTADDITANDIVVLLNILRSYFQYVVINLSGLPRSQFLQLTASHADKLFLLCEQSVPSCRSNKKLNDFLRENLSNRTNNIELILDRYLEKQEPQAQEIAERLGIPLKATLPSSGLVRLYMKNSGRTLFEFASQDKYTQAIEQLAQSLLGVTESNKQQNWFSSLKKLLPN